MEALECYYPHPPRRGGSLHRGLLRSAISPTFMAGFVRATMPMTVKMVRVHAECYCGVWMLPHVAEVHTAVPTMLCSWEHTGGGTCT